MNKILFGRVIIGFSKSGQPVFKNTGNNTGKVVGEIKLKKEPDDGICNICLKKAKGKLTKDHVPPACSGNRVLMRYRNAMNDTLNGSGPFLGLARGGIKFETICRECHDKLGIYDQAIADMFRVFSLVNMKKPIFPLCLKLRPNSIIRGIAGHFLSAKTTHIRGGFDDIFAEIISPLNPIPQKINFYVAPYFRPEIKILREMAMGAPPRGVSLLYVMKVYPYAFIITEKHIFPKVPRWNKYFNGSVDKEENVELFSIDPCPIHWPENPNYFKGLIVLGQGGAESIIAVPAKK